MYCFRLYPLILLTWIYISNVDGVKQKSSVISDLNNVKVYKKLLKTKLNVLVLYVNNGQRSQHVVDVFKDASNQVKGKATMAITNCSNSEGKKICKKAKIPNEKPYYIKHYKEGQFHIDYDRSETVNSITNFLEDPTGTLPWDEDPTALDIYHLQDGDAVSKFLKTSASSKSALIMFYAPWCGYCKEMKPDYVEAAADLKGEALLAAIDVSKPINVAVRHQFNISGFPTLLYFNKGQLLFTYNGDYKRDAIVEFMRDPSSQQRQKKKPADESWSQDSDVVHLTSENFKQKLSSVEHALVVFYAPWCGHCKKIKPEFEKAAAVLKAQGVKGVLGAVDATQQGELSSSFGVKGYPSLKYFNKGEYKYDVNNARQEDQIIQFIKNPQEPPPPPPPTQEVAWADEESQVRHLDLNSFKNVLRKAEHALVMFYAPWCGHCKTTKPEFTRAADRFADELFIAFAAVDCTTEQKLCASYDVKGYPTIKYFSFFNKLVKDYSGGRKEADFVSYIHSHSGRLQDSVKSAKTNQEAGFGVNVRLLTDDDFDQVIQEATPTYVMFYATWCGHCSTVKPAFSQLATAFKSANSPVKIVAIDAAENAKAADFASIQTLPMFKLFVAGKEIATYDGDRSAEDMTKFIKTAKVKDEL